MNFLHQREHLNKNDIVEVNCSHQCNIVLLNDDNLTKYKNSKIYTHHGGGSFFKKLPARLQAPSTGYWNILLDLDGRTATIKYSIRIIKS